MFIPGLKKFSSGQPKIDVKAYAFVIIASILNALSLMYVNYIFAWLAFPFLFYVLLKATGKCQMVSTGCLFGAASSLLLNFWMIPVIMKYAGGSTAIAVVCWIASAVVLAALFGFQFYLYHLIKVPGSRRNAVVFNAFLVASLWVLFEWFRAEYFSGIPWLSYSVGISLARDLLLIQPAAYGGVYILSFLIICSAYFVSFSVVRKQWKLLYIPILIVATQFGVGYLLYQQFQDEIEDKSSNKFSVALVLAALPPETVWNENSADALVRHLLSLNRQAVAKKPDLIVWTETVVPWTYAPDDDFLGEITKEISDNKIHTLLGMNSASGTSGNVLRNSGYLLDPAGKMASRYDKQGLLTFVEKPLFRDNGSLILPFFTGSGIKMLSGANGTGMNTPWGRTGLLLCNESTNSVLAERHVQSGASWLVNMGNDGWFSDYFITRQHFFNSRLRAVETRKDIIINNNMGTCGLVRASGEIAAQYNGKNSGVQLVEVTPNQLEATGPHYFICLILITITILLINRMYLMFKSNNAK